MSGLLACIALIFKECSVTTACANIKLVWNKNKNNKIERKKIFSLAAHFSFQSMSCEIFTPDQMAPEI